MYMQTLVSAIVSSAVISAVVSQLFSLWKERREQKREAFMLALDAAQTLEQYTRACAQMIVEGRAARNHARYTQDYDPLNGIDLPQFSYPLTIIWKGLDRLLVAELREFPNAVDAARRRIYVQSEYEDPIDGMWDEELEAARLGQRAWALAVKTRRQYEWPDAEKHERGEWDIHKALADKIEDGKQRDIRLVAHSAKVQDQISTVFAGSGENATDRSPTNPS